MALFHPKIEPGYPDNCITVEDAVNAIRKVYSHPSMRVQSFEIKAITDQGNKLRLAFDRKNVGQPASLEATR